jgi:4-hydroxybenzoate polyprenyltransferase
MLFDGQLFSLHALPAVITTLILFSLTSSAVYLFNDLLDIDADRHHPPKRNWPIASAQVSTQTGWLAIAGLLLVGFPSAFALSPRLAAVLAVYILVMLAYTFVLKHWVIMNVFVMAIGFVLRVVAGAVVIDVPISPWL